MFNFDDVNMKSKEAMDTAMKSYSDVAKGFQAIASEATEYSKKSFQDMASFVEALSGVKSFESAFELQSGYAKASYESFVAEATKMSEMYADLAKTVYKPYEAPFAAAGVAPKASAPKSAAPAAAA